MPTPAPVMIASLLDRLRETPLWSDLRRRLDTLAPGSVLSVSGMPGSLPAMFLSLVQEHLARPVCVTAVDREAAEQLRDDLLLCPGRDGLYFFGGQDHDNIQALRGLTQGPVTFLVTHPDALVHPVPRPGSVRESTLIVETGSEPGMARVLERLRTLGFEKHEFVGEKGQYAVRGGILDIYPAVGDHPVRIEFTGDGVESIREFDPLSQRSIKELLRAIILPDLLHPSDEAGGAPDGRLLDYLGNDPVLVFQDPAVCWRRMDELIAHDGRVTEVVAALRDVLPLFPQVHLLPLPLPGAVDAGGLSQPSFNGSIRHLVAHLAEQQRQGMRVVLLCDGQAERLRLKDLLATVTATPEENGDEIRLDLPSIELSLESLHGGFALPAAALVLYTEHQIFGRVKRRGRRRPVRFRGFTEREFQLLRKGDYVVHEDFGVGIFDGLQRITLRGVSQEVASVLYAEKDRLYVHLNYINRLQKYSSKEGHVPKLTRLGSPDWEKLKARAKSRIRDIARDLILLYAKRRATPGFGCSADAPWQKELEASFMYEDTFDQAKATREVKADMEAPYPMDRLICGDVGFGKTEVAVRAAFKAVLDGKQAAVLVPTTILALQHYHTFLDRTGRYGVRVEALSRLRSRPEQQQILRRLETGEIDIVIGTHRLLSKDVRFKDIGLLVIDEEHRFGVAAKEKLRQMRTEVDTLTLTATPIPRTLHFSLLGARDLSIIATAPRNRLPITTEIAQWNDDLIRDAVTRELARGGQVYFVHDRIQDLDAVSSRLHGILPHARIRSAHGQMHGREIEEVMLEFMEKRIDVLVATKIIESGLDIPNVNTIIIHRADRFGMAELYQLRGRVGRSNVQAYAYLLTPPISVLPRTTVQRLQAVQEFTELGSGFNLSMRDLEIRGAGNLLGAEQSGFIETMGFETYTRIIEETVQELKEQEFRDLLEHAPGQAQRARDTLVEVDAEALIPESYVGDAAERLALYRRLYALATPEQLEEIHDELRDRFGVPPPEVEHLFEAVRIRLAASKIGARKVHVAGGLLEIDFPPQEETRFYESELFQHIMTAISRKRGRGDALRQTGKSLRYVVKIPPSPTKLQMLTTARTLVVELSPPIESVSPTA